MVTADGRRIKSGKLIRSARLAGIGPDDRKKLAGILDAVIDFRDEVEKIEHPDAELEGVTYIELPILEKPAAGVTRDKKSGLEMLAAAIGDPARAVKLISGLYTNFVTEPYPVSQYRRFLDILLEEHDRGILWHCSGGKDRAGIGAAIVEEILGVPREDIIADYLKTNEYLFRDKALMMRDAKEKLPPGTIISQEALECLYYAKPEYINAFYHTAEQKYGDFGTFLSEGLQVTKEEIEHMQEMYLEDM